MLQVRFGSVPPAGAGGATALQIMQHPGLGDPFEVEATMLEDADVVMARAFPGDIKPRCVLFRRYTLEAGVPLWRYGVDATNNELFVPTETVPAQTI